MADFLMKSSYKNTDSFYDGISPEGLKNQLGQIRFTLSGSEDVVLSAYVTEGDTVLYSSINPDNVFQDNEFFNQVFVDKKTFLGY